MNRLLICVTICALAFLTKANAKDLEPQIKVTRIQIWKLNPKFFDELWFCITKHNETYNNIGVHWLLSQALPHDVVLNSRVYATDSKHKNAKLILEDNTTICTESPHRKLLPKVVVFDKNQLHGKCVKAGVINAKDMGNFRFEVLVPNIHEISDYHYVYYRVGNKKEIAVEVAFYSESGYLKKC